MNTNYPPENGMMRMGGRPEHTLNAVWRMLVRLTIIGVSLFAIYHLRTIIVTLLVGAIIAYTFEPVVDWMIHRGAFIRFHSLFLRSRAGQKVRVRPSRHSLKLMATLYTFIAALVILIAGVNLIVKPFREQIQQIATHREQYVRKYNRTIPPGIRQYIADKADDDDFKQKMQDTLMPIAAKGVSALANVVEIVLLPVLAFYFILDGKSLKKEFIALVPRRYFRDTARLLSEFNTIMRAFVLGQFILCALAGIVVGLGLAALGVKYAFVLGVLAGVTRAVPIVGPILGGIPIIALTYLDGGVGGANKAVAVLIFFTILHFAESKFIMPMLIGDRMELHPVVIIVVLLMGGEFGGLLLGGSLGALLGMFFAAPVAAILRVMIRRYRLHLDTRTPRPKASPSVQVAQTTGNITISLPEIAE